MARRLGEDLTAEEWAQLETSGGGSPPTYTPPQQWNRNLSVPIFGGTSAGNTVLYLIIGAAVLLLVAGGSKGR